MSTPVSTPPSSEEIIQDYRLAYQSRQASLIGRREVLSGKAKFGIFGDGKELPQLALARAFRKGDFRSGCYRDQTFMLAIGEINIQQYFAQLYAHTSLEAEPATAGRLMNSHFATRSINPDGSWKDLTAQYNSAADLSPTGSQMPRMPGWPMPPSCTDSWMSCASSPNFHTKGTRSRSAPLGTPALLRAVLGNGQRHRRAALPGRTDRI